MVKVKCQLCGECGYTAAPEYAICKCGGRYKVIQEQCAMPKLMSKKQTDR